MHAIVVIVYNNVMCARSSYVIKIIVLGYVGYVMYYVPVTLQQQNNVLVAQRRRIKIVNEKENNYM